MDTKTYQTILELKKQWKTTEELFKFLVQNGYPANIHTLRRWEYAGIIPVPKRVRAKGNAWRVYNLDGSDFNEILTNLEKKTLKSVRMKP